MEPLTNEELERIAAQVEFAQHAAQDVAVAAGELLGKHAVCLSKNPSKIEHAKNLAMLAGSLQCVSFDQEKYEQRDHQDLRSMMARLEQFLCGLELVCTFPKNRLSKSSKHQDVSARFPKLNTVIELPAPNLRSKEDREIQDEVSQSVDAFVSIPPEKFKRYLNFLKSFSQSEGQAKKRAELAQQHAEVQSKNDKTKSLEDESYPRHVYDTLYNFLKKYAECCCGLPSPSPMAMRSHWGRLELKENFRVIDNEVVFHTLFTKKGSFEFVENIKWQHLQFRISKRQRNVKTVVIEDPKHHHGVKQSATPDWETEPIKLDHAAEIKSSSEFCNLLNKDIGSGCMDVRIKDEIMFQLKHAVDIEVDIADERSMSLANVLDRYSLAPKIKLLIAYILAKSIWQFYDSNFMNVQWTTESIQLFREKEDEDEDTDEPTIDWAPYFAFSYDKISEFSSVERLPPGQILHRYPRLLALGTLLYELGRKRRSQRQASSLATLSPNPAGSPTLEKVINDTTRKIRNGVKKKHWPDIKLKDAETLETYRLVVASCASEGFFVPQPQGNSQKSLLELEEQITIEERRKILLEKVVNPLKKLVQGTGWVDKDGNIQRQQVDGVAARLKEVHDVAATQPAALLTNSPHSAGNGDSSSALGTSAEAWLNEHKSSLVAKTVASAFETQPVLSKNRIRIAVLDTGYDPGAVFFNRERKRRIKDWKDYVEKDNLMKRDEDGHGTHVLSVLMKVAPAADIFVARVARDTTDLQQATKNVAEAIQWASKDCEANIITMSFGFDEEIRVDNEAVISRAILKALLETEKRILFFAAAANDGGNRQEMFPAHDMHVLSIRGTDDYGWAQRFNPPPDYNAATCFMTLGMDVPGASLSTSKDEGADVCKSGTSVATPIAAGIAATLLGYTRIFEEDLKKKLEAQHMEKLANVWGLSGMTILFEKMATEMTDKWSYLNIKKFTDLPHDLRLATIALAAKESKG